MVGYVGLGSNVGDRDEHLRRGVVAIARAGMPVTAVSSVWETEPVDGAGPEWFLNLVIRVDTVRSAEEALAALLEVERSRGRVRTRPNAPRTLDCDLLILGDEHRATEALTLPHPRMWTRAFVLAPLAEIAPDLRNPATGSTAAETLERLGDPHAVRRVGPLALPETLPLYSRAL